MIERASPASRSVAALLGAGSFALLAGCASAPLPPDTQMEMARNAVAAARSAGSAEYAPGVLALAEEKLDLGTVAVANRRYADARRLAEASEVDARLAAATARSRRAQHDVDTVEADIQALKDAIARSNDPYARVP